MTESKFRQAGFTLVEVAITLMIVGILLGYTVALFPQQQELKQYRQANEEMDRIVEYLIGFAQVNGRLPCPDTNGNVHGPGGIFDGVEDTHDRDDNIDITLGGADGIPDSCRAYYGFLPAVTLGINGDFGDLGRLVDPWGQPYRYAVSTADSDSDANPNTFFGIDVVTPNGVREEGVANAVPNLSICDDSNNASAADANCAAVGGTAIVGNAAAVVISSGRDRGQLGSNVQNENRDNFHNGLNDRVYVSTTRSDVVATRYDDIVRWISPNLLYSKMVEAEQLP